MKHHILAIVLFSFTALGVIIFPEVEARAPNHTPQAPVANPTINNTINQTQISEIEVVFVLDTTGSMSGMIQAAKEKIWSIATTLAAAESAPQIRIGLVAFRDRSDDYVTRVVDLSSDLDNVFAQLMQFQANGGGDTPESVNKALHDAIHQISWSNNRNAYQVVFLVGDAPAHTDYQNDVPFHETLAVAQQRGILVNTIQCGEERKTRQQWQQIASLGGGEYLSVAQNGGAIASATPFDSKLAELAHNLESTRLYYGDADKRKKLEAKRKTSDELYSSAPKAALAQRAKFHTTVSGETNLLGESELLNDIEQGKVRLEDVDKDHLPAEISTLPEIEQAEFVQSQIALRQQLEEEITAVAEQRRAYLKEKVADADDAAASLDYQVFDTLKKQAETKGLFYDVRDLAL